MLAINCSTQQQSNSYQKTPRLHWQINWTVYMYTNIHHTMASVTPNIFEANKERNVNLSSEYLMLRRLRAGRQQVCDRPQTTGKYHSTVVGLQQQTTNISIYSFNRQNKFTKADTQITITVTRALVWDPERPSKTRPRCCPLRGETNAQRTSEVLPF